MDSEALGRALLILGGAIVVTGAVILLLARMGLSGFPGDISIRGDNYAVYFSIVTSIIVSIILTIALNIFLRLR